MRRAAIFLVMLAAAAAHVAAAAEKTPLELLGKIPLGNVSGRIDHMAIDSSGHRLFVAELGNNTVAVVNLLSGAVTRSLTGFHSPQGVGYVVETASLVIANAGDGSVRIFRGADLLPTTVFDLMDDADNVRVDLLMQNTVVGFGAGALAVFDNKTGEKKSEIRLKAHPEGFQIDTMKQRAYVNVPDAHEIAVVDLTSGRQIASWDKLPGRSNFPMALFADGKRVAVAFRSPARLVIFNTSNGSTTADWPTCGDSDDIFFDARRDRLYVSCGEGKIDVFEAVSSAPKLMTQITTASGARTAFFDAQGDRYYLAVRAGLTREAEIWVYRPTGP